LPEPVEVVMLPLLPAVNTNPVGMRSA